jgi:hypothetical protein
LAICYTTEINKVIEKSGGIITITKRMFWDAFKPVWDRSISESNILSVWSKTGIWPYKPQVILDSIALPRPEIPPEVPLDAISTPYTAKCMRQFTKTYAKNPIKDAFRKLTKANETNTVKASITEHRTEGLKEALQIEKKKRHCGKKLNLTGEPAGKAQFFGTAEVLAAIACKNGKIAGAEQDKLDKQKAKEDAKIAKATEDALKKQEKELEKLRKAEEKEIANQMKKEKYKLEVLERAAARKVATVARNATKKAKPSRIVILRVGSSILSNLGAQEAVIMEEDDSEAMGVVQTSRSGREIILPQRLRK